MKNEVATETKQNPRISAQRLIGTEAFDAEGRPVGHIADLMIEPCRGVIAFVVLRHRGKSNQMKRFAIPLHVCTLHTDSVTVRVDPDTLAHSPGRW